MPESTRPNFFILLGIDPSQPWTEIDFKNILINKREEWTRKRRNPRNALQYDSYLHMVPQIEAVMTDKELRENEAREALKLESDADQELRKQFFADLKLVASKGFITEEDITKLVKDFAKFITDGEVRSEAAKQSIEIRQPTTEVKEVEDTLHSSTMEEIKQKLKILNKKDLYDFLDASRMSSHISELVEKAGIIYKKNQDHGLKTPEITASSDLTGKAKAYFKDEESRKRYDRSLDKEAFTVLDEAISKVVSISEKMINAKSFQALLEIARSASLDIDKAAKYIRDRARKMNVYVEMSGIENVKQKLLCPNPVCRAVNDQNHDFCSKCSSPLRVKCPSCSQSSPIEDRACSKCGFPIGNSFNVRTLISDAKSYIGQKQYSEAVIYLKLASQQWSITSSPQINDELTQQIQKYLKEAEPYLQRKTNLVKQLNNAIDERYFYKAQKFLRDIEAEFGSEDIGEANRKITSAINKAETEILEAQKIEAKGGDAVEIYQKILTACKDFPLALEALAKNPPAPPIDLTARIGDRVVSLSWKSSPTRNIRYTIVRKYGSRPVSGNDGDCLDTVSGTNYDDTKANIGISIYYAIYANREGILSTSSAELNIPVLLMGDILNVSKQISDKQVSITWQPPENAVDVYAFRATYLSKHPEKEQKIEVFNKSTIVNRNLQNGTTYYYNIYAVFTNHEGNQVKSKGILIEATPEEPPSIVENLDLEVIQTSPNRQLRASWTPPNKGEVGILVSQKKTSLSIGNILSEAGIDIHGKLVLGTKNEAVITLDQGVVTAYFIPVVLFQKTAYVGNTIEYTNIDDVKNLKVRKQKNELQLQWDWTKDCQQVVLAHSHIDFPSCQPSNKNATCIKVTRAQYDLHGYYSIKNPLPQDYYVIVYAVVLNNGQEMLASGSNETAKLRISLGSLLNIQYEVRSQRKFLGLFGTNKLTLIVKMTGIGEMPSMVFVRKQSPPPLSKLDGDVILTIPASLISSEHIILSFDIEPRSRSYCKLFLEDEDLYEAKGGYVRIDHPSRDKLEAFFR